MVLKLFDSFFINVSHQSKSNILKHLQNIRLNCKQRHAGDMPNFNNQHFQGPSVRNCVAARTLENDK